MDSQALTTVALSLGLILSILGFSWFLLRVSKAEAKAFKGITVEAQKWIHLSKSTGWLCLLMVILLMAQPKEAMVELFLISFGLYAIAKSIGMFKAKRVYLVGGTALYGKTATIVSLIDLSFGTIVLALGLAGILGGF